MECARVSRLFRTEEIRTKQSLVGEVRERASRVYLRLSPHGDFRREKIVIRFSSFFLACASVPSLGYAANDERSSPVRAGHMSSGAKARARADIFIPLSV